MKIWRVIIGWLVTVATLLSEPVFGAAGLNDKVATPPAAIAPMVDPVVTFRKAVEQLCAAGNYSWRESREFAYNDRSAVNPYGFGRTQVEGYSIATIFMRTENLRAVFLGNRTVFETKEGWRRFDEMTAEEIEKLFALPSPLRMPGAKHRHPHTPAHLVLRLLLESARDIREENGEIVGSVGVNAQACMGVLLFIRSGVLPARELIVPSGNPMVRSRSVPRPTVSSDVRGTFSVSLEDGKIVKFSVRFERFGTSTGAAEGGPSPSLVEAFSTTFTDVGTTQVNIEPEVRALF